MVSENIIERCISLYTLKLKRFWQFSQSNYGSGSPAQVMFTEQSWPRVVCVGDN